tara:strand:- start:167 stop:1195 length:1029 start_codon:yes stop_codon:yes gene_type:complete
LKFAVFISAGIGNAIFLIPLFKALRKQGSVAAILASPFESEQIFQGFEDDYFDSSLDFRGSTKTLSEVFFNIGSFDAVFMDYFSCSRRNIIASHFIASEIHCYQIPPNLPDFFKSKLTLHKLSIGEHEGLQNLGLHQPINKKSALSNKSFISKAKKNINRNLGEYITVQPGAGNNLTPWKIWDLTNWMRLFGKMALSHPKLKIILLGDSFDMQMTAYLKSANDNVISLINQTKLEELPPLLSEGIIHIGGDSGLLHIAGAVQTKTITIVGGSDPNIFGWHQIDYKKHRLVQNKLECHPCYRHYLPNQTRTSNPLNCPDFKCIRSITAEQVYNVFVELMQIKD